IPISMIYIRTPPSLLSTSKSFVVLDLESVLRENLESNPTLRHSPLHVDKVLEDSEYLGFYPRLSLPPKLLFISLNIYSKFNAISVQPINKVLYRNSALHSFSIN
ncbi:unnamed protein product, partial [Heterotrigona itama]